MDVTAVQPACADIGPFLEGKTGSRGPVRARHGAHQIEMKENLMDTRSLGRLGSAFLLMMSLAAGASAQATRTWVSGVGADANPCSRTAPCKTWAGAFSKTAIGGEIDALDPGGFGTLTINKSITLNGEGTIASILVSSGTNGINVNAGPLD